MAHPRSAPERTSTLADLKPAAGSTVIEQPLIEQIPEPPAPEHPTLGETLVSGLDHRVGPRRILAVLTQLGIMNVAIGLGGVVRNKVMAVYLKPAGFGEFTQ